MRLDDVELEMGPLELWQVMYGKEIVRFKNNWKFTRPMTKQLAEIFLGMQSPSQLDFLLFPRDLTAHSVLPTVSPPRSHEHGSQFVSSSHLPTWDHGLLISDVDVFSDDPFFVPLVLTAFLSKLRVNLMMALEGILNAFNWTVTRSDHPLVKLLVQVKRVHPHLQLFTRENQRFVEELTLFENKLRSLLDKSPQNLEECEIWLKKSLDCQRYFMNDFTPRAKVLMILQHDYRAQARLIEQAVFTNDSCLEEFKHLLMESVFSLDEDATLKFHEALFNVFSLSHLPHFRFYLLSLLSPEVLSRVVIRVIFFFLDHVNSMGSCSCQAFSLSENHTCLIREYWRFRKYLSELEEKATIIRELQSNYEHWQAIKEDFVTFMEHLTLDVGDKWELITNFGTITLKLEEAPFYIAIYHVRPTGTLKVILSCSDCQSSGKDNLSFFPCIRPVNHESVVVSGTKLSKEDALLLGQVYILMLYANALQSPDESKKRKMVQQHVDVVIMNQFARHFGKTCKHYQWIIK